MPVVSGINYLITAPEIADTHNESLDEYYLLLNVSFAYISWMIAQRWGVAE